MDEPSRSTANAAPPGDLPTRRGEVTHDADLVTDAARPTAVGTPTAGASAGASDDDTIEVIDALRREPRVYNATAHVNAIFQLQAEGKLLVNGRIVLP